VLVTGKKNIIAAMHKKINIAETLLYSRAGILNYFTNPVFNI
jgi:hypothetical protein